MAWNTHYCCEIYAAALVEAGNTDAKFTMNSAMYQAAVSAITCDGWGCPDDFVSKLLRSIPQCRVDLHDFYKGMGLGWRVEEEWLEEELQKLFEPEVPRPGILKELDFKCWWGAYDDLLNFYEYELAQEDYEEDTGDSGCNSDEDEGFVTSMAFAEDYEGCIEDEEASDDEDENSGDDFQQAAKL